MAASRGLPRPFFLLEAVLQCPAKDSKCIRPKKKFSFSPRIFPIFLFLAGGRGGLRLADVSGFFFARKKRHVENCCEKSEAKKRFLGTHLKRKDQSLFKTWSEVWRAIAKMKEKIQFREAQKSKTSYFPHINKSCLAKVFIKCLGE